MTERLCQSCHDWYDKKLGPCPECGEIPSGHNRWLATASMNNQIYTQAESAVKEQRLERAFASRRRS